jgi:hypothetical protein
MIDYLKNWGILMSQLISDISQAWWLNPLSQIIKSYQTTACLSSLHTNSPNLIINPIMSNRLNKSNTTFLRELFRQIQFRLLTISLDRLDRTSDQFPAMLEFPRWRIMNKYITELSVYNKGLVNTKDSRQLCGKTIGRQNSNSNN